jgi:hypothetical protein
MTDALRRAIRTFIQAFLGSIISSGVLSAVATTGAVDLSNLQKVGAAGLAAGLIALVSFAQNALEDGGQIPALLKAPASDGADPVPDPEPEPPAPVKRAARKKAAAPRKAAPRKKA